MSKENPSTLLNLFNALIVKSSIDISDVEYKTLEMVYHKLPAFSGDNSEEMKQAARSLFKMDPNDLKILVKEINDSSSQQYALFLATMRALENLNKKANGQLQSLLSGPGLTLSFILPFAKPAIETAIKNEIKGHDISLTDEEETIFFGVFHKLLSALLESKQGPFATLRNHLHQIVSSLPMDEKNKELQTSYVDLIRFVLTEKSTLNGK